MENKSGFKLVVFGPYGAGKTNIINRFTGNPFDKSYPVQEVEAITINH